MGRNNRWGLLMVCLLLLAVVCVQQCQAKELDGKAPENVAELEEEDLSFLDDEEEDEVAKGSEEEEEEEEGLPAELQDDPVKIREFDEKDVSVLVKANFSKFIHLNHYVLVEFYAPWCGHCREFAPDYAEAATMLKGSALFAKVDATEQFELAQEYGVDGYPSIFLFIDGVHKTYPGNLLKDEVVAWMKMKTRPATFTLHSKDVAETVNQFQEGTMAITLLNSLEGPEAEEYAYAARQVDDVLFYQTTSAQAAEIFNFTKGVKRPALLLLKKEAEKVSWYDDQFTRASIVEFVIKYKVPLVTTFNKKTVGLIFDTPIKKQVIVFTGSDDYDKLIPGFREVARSFVGKLIFVHVDLEDAEQAPALREYFGISGTKPVVMGYIPEEGWKYSMEGESTVANVQAFGENFLSGNVKAQVKSDPIPETNDENVKAVVGLTFDDIVLDVSKDVFLEVYAPWCGQCQALQPTWEKLAKRLSGVESIVIAKMDGTTNEHELAKSVGYPNLLLFPAGKTSSEPITFDGQRTVKELVMFLKKQAAIQFKVPRNLDTKLSKPGFDVINDDLRNPQKDEL